MQHVARYEKNTLADAASPYLQSHQHNPVWWQQWTPEVLAYARQADKPLLVSVGYSTCHWCHVMAREAFSDQGCANAINRDFVPIKVDREERPDIDQHLMSFLVATTGRGGWPLNAFLTPELTPFFAMTYAAVEPRFGMPSFVDILKQVIAFYREHRDRLHSFELSSVADSASAAKAREGSDSQAVETRLAENDRLLLSRFDRQAGGLAGVQKFPPHTSLLYALHRLDSHSRDAIAAVRRAGLQSPSERADAAQMEVEGLQKFVRRTLDVMHARGLYDHLAGGFFRYTVDANWTIPHFEKMLYDQALCLWNYSLAARSFGNRAYRKTATGVIDCLNRDFLEDGLFNAAIDADTEHDEGATYIWSFQELRDLLSFEQLAAVTEAFEVTEQGNFEGRIHLVRVDGPRVTSSSAELDAALQTLLEARRRRPQPFVDRKKLTFWNALTGIALLTAERSVGSDAARRIADRQLEALMSLHVRQGNVLHATLDGRPFGGRFLADYAAMLLLLTYHHEDHRRFAAEIRLLRDAVRDFEAPRGSGEREQQAEGENVIRRHWREADESDFLPVAADPVDSPLPASDALAETALARAAMVLGEEYRSITPGRPALEDFRNTGVLMTAGYCCWVTGPLPVPWQRLPLFSVQGEGTDYQYCVAGTCTRGLPPTADPAE